MYLLTAIAGEVSIFGESLGGYASCYAAASRPSQFKRALCLSPSFWWNYGSLSTQIPQLHAQHKESPTAVVMTLGTQESPQLYVPANYPNNTSKDKITWAQSLLKSQQPSYLLVWAPANRSMSPFLTPPPIRTWSPSTI